MTADDLTTEERLARLEKATIEVGTRLLVMLGTSGVRAPALADLLEEADARGVIEVHARNLETLRLGHTPYPDLSKTGPGAVKGLPS